MFFIFLFFKLSLKKHHNKNHPEKSPPTFSIKECSTLKLLNVIFRTVHIIIFYQTSKLIVLSNTPIHIYIKLHVFFILIIPKILFNVMIIVYFNPIIHIPMSCSFTIFRVTLSKAFSSSVSSGFIKVFPLPNAIHISLCVFSNSR